MYMFECHVRICGQDSREQVSSDSKNPTIKCVDCQRKLCCWSQAASVFPSPCSCRLSRDFLARIHPNPVSAADRASAASSSAGMRITIPIPLACRLHRQQKKRQAQNGSRDHVRSSTAGASGNLANLVAALALKPKCSSLYHHSAARRGPWPRSLEWCDYASSRIWT